MRIFGSILFMASLLSFLMGCGGSGNSTASPKEWQKAKQVGGPAKLDHPRAFAADDKFVYFITGATVAGQQAGANNLMKMPVGGGEPIVLFKGGESIPSDNAITADDTHIYFSAGGLRRVPKAGGEAEIIVKNTNAWELLTDAQNIYWRPYVGEGMSPQPIFTAPKTGGEAKPITDARLIGSLVQDEKSIYWMQTDGLYKMAKTGGNVEQVYSSKTGETAVDLGADSANFYFLSGKLKRDLMSLPKSGGEAKKVAGEVSRFWVGNDEVVFIRRIDFSNDALFKLSGGSETELDRNGYAADLIVGKDKIYLSDIDRLF